MNSHWAAALPRPQESNNAEQGASAQTNLTHMRGGFADAARKPLKLGGGAGNTNIQHSNKRPAEQVRLYLKLRY